MSLGGVFVASGGGECVNVSLRCGTRLVLVVRLLAIGLTELHQGKVCMRLGIDDGTGCMLSPGTMQVS